MKDREFKWEKQRQYAFDALKLKLSSTPMLRGPNWFIPFHISIDASHKDLGIVLGKKDNQIYCAIYFVSKNLTPTELNYTVTKKEFLAVVHAINEFSHYITRYEVFIHTNHSAILFVMKNPITNGRITRWLMLTAFGLDLGISLLRSNKPLDHWPFWQQAVKQPAVSPEVTYGGTKK